MDFTRLYMTEQMYCTCTKAPVFYNEIPLGHAARGDSNFCEPFMHIQDFAPHSEGFRPLQDELLERTISFASPQSTDLSQALGSSLHTAMAAQMATT